MNLETGRFLKRLSHELGQFLFVDNFLFFIVSLLNKPKDIMVDNGFLKHKNGV